VAGINVSENGKPKYIIKSHIEDAILLHKIRQIDSWLKIYPLWNYYFNETEYQNYKEFMEKKKYLTEHGTLRNMVGRIINP
jgi:hypothetical protein